MKNILKLLCILLFVTACSSQKVRLDSSLIKTDERIVFGKLTDLNKEGRDLRLTYLFSEYDKEGLLTFNNLFPNIDTDSGYFWVSIPKETNYIGVRSIHFSISGRTGSANIRDEKNHRVILGTPLVSGSSPVYIGDIEITSGMIQVGKSLVGIPVERFDVKKIEVKNNTNNAKSFLESRNLFQGSLNQAILKIK